MILVVNGKKYPAASVKDLSLKHTLELSRELATTDISSAKSWQDVQQLFEEFSALSKEEQQKHPEGLFLTALTIWATRVAAGEELSLLDAVDVPPSVIQWVAEPADKQPAGKPKASRSTPAAGGKSKTSTPK